MSRTLVTGASGFVGPFLICHLLAEGHEVVGTVHYSSKELPEGCHSIPLNITDRDAVRRTIAETSPDEVYHLAGVTRPTSGSGEEYYETNFSGALNLFEAVREEAPETDVLLVGSAYAYGRVDHPIIENNPLNPINHYGVSKAAADMLGYCYAVGGLRVVRARPFNHSGPGQSPDFLLPALIEQFAAIKAGRRDPIVYLGNLGSVRDLSDVRDVVRAYRLILRDGRSGEAYNVGSGRGVSVRELFELVCREVDVEVRLSVEPSRVRATDIPYLVADAGKVHRELGWEPKIPLAQTIKEMLETA
jgi:GDP-4-dehydro-6-deoxy-D-mannose reductase